MQTIALLVLFTVFVYFYITKGNLYRQAFNAAILTFVIIWAILELGGYLN